MFGALWGGTLRECGWVQVRKHKCSVGELGASVRLSTNGILLRAYNEG